MIYVLILFAHVGALGNGNSNSITTAEFNSEQSCYSALSQATKLASGSTKLITGVCVKK